MPAGSPRKNYRICRKNPIIFVDFLEKCHQTYWQVLPIGPTSYGDSPYQSFSVFAGNPYFIDFDLLEADGLIEKSDYENLDFGSNETQVDYGKLFNNKYKVLRKAYENSKQKYAKEILKFKDVKKSVLC